MDWYYVDRDQRVGPFSQEDIIRLVNQGVVRETTLVWHAGMSEWQPYASVSMATGDVMAAPAADPRDQYDDYGGFWIRFVAKFIDGIVLGLLNVLLSVASGIVLAILAGRGAGAMPAAMGAMAITFVLQMIFSAFYATWFVGRYGATPGKMACRLRVVRPDGTEVGYGRAFGRYLAEILSMLTLYIGYLIAAFDPEKRSLHDRVCDTRVMHRR